MSLLDGLVGGAVGAEMASVVNGLIQKHGGVQGIVTQLQQQGLGATVQSWINDGPNQPISPNQVHQAFGTDTINAIAAKLGMNPQDLAQRLSQALPQIIDKLTPNGTVPSK
ncbi:MAG: DUF937 domain-containing protein [Acetobacteraceae bacterium]|nr:DUF937 domain-containing protein [Acetobacteraceae bacterium]